MPTVKPVLLKTLDKDAETGLIVESVSLEKMVAFRTSTFLTLMDKLVGMLGITVSGTLLNQMGINVGGSMFAHLSEDVKSDRDLVTLMDVVLAERGWGRCRELNQVGTSSVYSVKTEGNPIIGEQGKYGKYEPMCQFLKGIYAGFLQAYLHKKAVTSEQISCKALGAPYCTFQITLE